MNERFLATMRTLVAPQMLMANTEPYGDSVRLRKRDPADLRPPYLYLIYLALDHNGLVFRHAEQVIDPFDLDNEEDSLIRAAKRDAGQLGSNYGLLEFTTATNFTIVLDEDNWDFYYPDPGNPEPEYVETHDPILFVSEKTFVGDDLTLVSRRVSRNRAFYDLEPITKVIDGKPRKGIRCINHLTKNDQGGPLGKGEKIDYSFNLYLRVPFSKTTPTEKITIIIDPDGQNQGPPEGPAPIVEEERMPVLKEILA